MSGKLDQIRALRESRSKRRMERIRDESRSERASAAAPRNAPAKSGEGKQGLKPRASRVAAGRTAAQAPEQSAPAVSIPKPTVWPNIYKPGRPRLEDRDKTLAATEPWKAAGMSRASWYRRKPKRKKKVAL